MRPAQSVHTWRFLRLVINRHRGTFRSTTWHLIIGWGHDWPGPTGVAFTWKHR